MGSTHDNLAELTPRDVAHDIASSMEEFVNADYFLEDAGLSYRVDDTTNNEVILTAQADDESDRTFIVRIEEVRDTQAARG